MAAATIDAFHAALSPSERAVCDVLRGALDAGLPGAAAKVWHAHPVWFLDGNPIAGYSVLKSGVRLMFWSGQGFDVPGLKPSGSFKAAEVRYTRADQVDTGQVAAWCAEGIAVQWDYKNIVKRKGRLERLRKP